MNMVYWRQLTALEKINVLSRPRSSEAPIIKEQVMKILEKVRTNGDEALIQLTEQYDRIKLNTLKVDPYALQDAFVQISPRAKEAIEFIKNQLEKNHQSQLSVSQQTETIKGVICERQLRSIERIGLYVPGGSAPLISTVLMLAVPAQIANCPVRILCTPANSKNEIDPHILVAAQLCGIENIYKIGGAQAIAAMAYGTETVPRVNKIFGPGNKWVTQAKMIIAEGLDGAGIDMPAGPSELMIIADDHTDPDYVAADLLSQAEHGIDSQVILIALSEKFIFRVQEALQLQLQHLPRATIVQQSLLFGKTIIVNDLQEAIEVCNKYAPEHLSLQVDKADQWVPAIQNAGAVFIGRWTPVTIGDYVTGANHVLPTSGFARHYSGLSVLDFMKYISFQKATPSGLKTIASYAQTLAELEGLHAHGQAVSIRLAGLPCYE